MSHLKYGWLPIEIPGPWSRISTAVMRRRTAAGTVQHEFAHEPFVWIRHIDGALLRPIVNASMNSKLSVYLVEDSIRIRDLLVEFVMENDIGRVVGYTDSEFDAVTDIVRLKPDAVVLDIRLRVGNGL